MISFETYVAVDKNAWSTMTIEHSVENVSVSNIAINFAGIEWYTGGFDAIPHCYMRSQIRIDNFVTVVDNHLWRFRFTTEADSTLPVLLSKFLSY